MAEAKPRAALQLGAQWRSLRGCAWGIMQPTLTGQVLAEGTNWAPGQFNAYMADLLGEENAPEAGESGAVSIAHALLYWYCAIQRGQRLPIFGCGRVLRATREGEATRYDVALPWHDLQASSATLKWLGIAMNAFAGDAARHAADRARADAGFEPLLAVLREHSLSGTNNFSMLQAAHARAIPWRALVPATFSVGLGAKSRRFQSTLTDATGALGMQVAHSKRWTAHVLRLFGVPVPAHALVADEAAAVAAAGRLGFPVVVKPDDQEQGRGVSAGLASEEAVREAYAVARAFGPAVLVEKHHAGTDYRINVMEGEVIKILHRRSGAVDGDGVHTVAQLIELELQGRLRRPLRQLGRRLLDLDAEALSLLEEQGTAPNDVPAPGTRVVLRRKSNISAGGIQALIPPEQAHPDNLALALDATQAVGLDLCGVDVLLPDITQSWRETGGVVIEVNAKPQIGHSVGPEAYDRIIARLVEGDGRVPVHLAVQAGDDVDFGELQSLATSLGCNGLATVRGAWVNGRRRGEPFANGLDAARRLLLDTEIVGALCVVSAGEIVANGLPVDRVTRIHVIGSPADSSGQAVLDQALALAAPHAQAA